MPEQRKVEQCYKSDAKKITDSMYDAKVFNEKTKVDLLIEERDKIQLEINKIYIKAEKKRKEQLKNLVGCCLKNEFAEFKYRKLLEWIDHEEFGLHFIFEELSIDNEGKAKIEIVYEIANITKEWANKKIPLYGWEKEITKKQYVVAKNKVLKEMKDRKKIKKFLMSGK